MKFEHALIEFVLKLKEEYGMQTLIKSIELSEEMYQCVEVDLLEKPSVIQPGFPNKIKFYCCNEVIDINRNRQEKDKQ